MSGGGKGASESTKIDDFTKGIITEMAAYGKEVGSIPYQPWTGVDVAARRPQQIAGMQSMADMGNAFAHGNSGPGGIGGVGSNPYVPPPPTPAPAAAAPVTTPTAAPAPVAPTPTTPAPMTRDAFKTARDAWKDGGRVGERPRFERPPRGGGGGNSGGGGGGGSGGGGGGSVSPPPPPAPPPQPWETNPFPTNVAAGMPKVYTDASGAQGYSGFPAYMQNLAANKDTAAADRYAGFYDLPVSALYGTGTGGGVTGIAPAPGPSTGGWTPGTGSGGSGSGGSGSGSKGPTGGTNVMEGMLDPNRPPGGIIDSVTGPGGKGFSGGGYT
jgi:hypothetical protein